MLPILRIIPVGGVLLAIMILVLSLSSPSGLNPGLMPAASLARGALMQLGEHPEWRQFLFLAATRRADELNSLRDLPDMPPRGDRAAGKTAGLPVERSAAEPDDETGSINPTSTSTATIPIEIGEPSSTELPVIAPAETLPVIRTPERVKAPGESHKRGVRHVRRLKSLAKTQPAPAADPLEALFAAPQNRIAVPQKRSASAPARSKASALVIEPAVDPATPR